MDIDRPDSLEEDVLAPGSARQVDPSDQETRTKLMPSCSGVVVTGDPAAMADQKRIQKMAPSTRHKGGGC